MYWTTWLVFRSVYQHGRFIKSMCPLWPLVGNWEVTHISISQVKAVSYCRGAYVCGIRRKKMRRALILMIKINWADILYCIQWPAYSSGYFLKFAMFTAKNIGSTRNYHCYFKSIQCMIWKIMKIASIKYPVG